MAPGNTLRSISYAAHLGVDLVEVDVRLSSDGHLVLWHDKYVSAGSSRLRIADSTFESLHHAVDRSFGEELVDLEQTMRAISGEAGLLVDLKVDGLADRIVEAVRSTAFSPAVLCGDDWDAMREAQRMLPEIGTSLTLGRTYRLGLSRPRFEKIDTNAVTISHHIASTRLIERFHERGIAVLAWTIDGLPRMRRLLQMGIDGITSNRPDLFGEIE